MEPAKPDLSEQISFLPLVSKLLEQVGKIQKERFEIIHYFLEFRMKYSLIHSVCVLFKFNFHLIYNPKFRELFCYFIILSFLLFSNTKKHNSKNKM